MKKLTMNSILLLMSTLFIFITPQNTFATSWAHAFVVWDGYIYVITDEAVENVDKKIGRVTKYSDMEPQGGNFSNHYPKGTTYYSIEGISTDVAIAVEEAAGHYIKAVRDGKYEYLGSVWQKIKVVLGIFAIVIVGFIIYSQIQKKK